MEFLILGPLEVRDQRGPVPLGGTKPRAVLAVLLLHANTPVSPDRLAVALWGLEAPSRAVKTVQVHVSRLRKALGEANAIETSDAGYRLVVRPGELDAQRFEQLADDGRRALAAGDADAAATILRSALALWRGPPLADLSGLQFAQAEIARLEEQRLTAVEARIDADLARGREAELVGELQRLIAAYPTRERLAEQLMLALYRRGRQADALEAYRETRRVLVEEVGIEPGPELRELQAAILRQDRALLGNRAAELPPELERTATLPMEGRDAELAWLRDRWQHVRAGAATVVTVRGDKGMGKSRLAAELAAEAHADGAVVLFADGAGPPDAVFGVLARAKASARPTLLVVDDADRAPAAVREELAALPPQLVGRPILALVLDGDVNGGPDGDSIILAPLGPEAVHAIVSRYTPDYADEPPPDAWLLGASHGNPQLVHELAGQWARREAARRVQTGAERTAARRADLRTIQGRLAADVAVLEAVRERGDPATSGRTLVCPFKGLASFQVSDAPYFFGRERLVAELVARLVGAPLLGIVGPSGSGKSSALRAGLLPTLAAGVLPGSDHWQQVLIRPGAHPLERLHTALAPLADEPVVLALDQFEEVFTLCESERERSAFVAELVDWALEHDVEGTVALALRADFYGRCADYPELSRLLAANHVLVGGMRPDELRRAVECPAQRAGLVMDPELVDALVADVEGEPGALPLLSTALLELWQQRDGPRLRHAAYERVGGVRGAVARLGEDAYAHLDERQQQVARDVLLRLATVEDDGAVERRRVAPEELGGAEVAAVVGLLADRRLLTIDAGTVELAHEALLREWPRLRSWVAEDQSRLRFQRGLSAAAREWERLDRDDGALLRGARLAEAREWAPADGPELGRLEREFVDASFEYERRERQAHRRRVQLLFGALTAGLIVIGAVALVALHQRSNARHERDLALSRSLALQSAQTLDTDPGLALRLALWAGQISPTRQADAALRQATLDYRQLGVLPADPQTAETAAYSPDGRRIVTGGDTGVARAFDAATHRRLAQLDPKLGKLMTARFSPDGRQIALGFEKGAVLLTDASLSGARTLLRAGGAQVNRVAFSPDGARLAAALDNGAVRVVSVADGRTVRSLSIADGGATEGVDLDAAGDVAAADDGGGVTLWNAAGRTRLLRSAGDTELAVRFSPDGRVVVAVGMDGWVRMWRVATGESVAEVLVGARPLTSVAFSPDGSRFATGGYDGAVRVWSTNGASQLLVLQGQLSRVYDVGFGRSRDRVVSAGDDGSARVWDAGGLQTFTGRGVTEDVEFSHDGRLIATGSDNGDVRLWNPRTGALVRSVSGRDGRTFARFSPVADELVIARWATSSLFIWPLSTPRPQRLLRLHPGDGEIIARFSPDGTRLIYDDAGKAGTLAVRSVRTGSTIRLGGAPALVYDARISPDEKQAAAVTESGRVLLWRLDRPQRIAGQLVGHRGHINTFDWARDGRIVTAGADRTVRVWDSRTRRGKVLSGHTDEVTTAAFMRGDPNHVLSTSADGTVRLWDARTGDALAVLQQEQTGIYDIAQSPDGTIATLDGNEVVHIFHCPVCGSLAAVRARALADHPPELTDEQRQQFLTESG